MTDGTGKSAQVDGYLIGAKTGTAEKLPRGNGKYLLSYMGFAPADNPEVLIYVIIDEANVQEQATSSLVKGLAKGLNVKERVVSPTYTIMCQYFGDKMLCHFDLYRITEDDCYNMGFDDFFFDENVICAVEWSERLTDLPENILRVDIQKTGESTRKITVVDEKSIIKGEL
jgi:tRNA threonylcarbamoyl adenosine modification protein YjeE